MKRKMLSIAMALAMMLSLLPVTALAAEPKPADGAPTASGTYFFANGTPITITAAAPENGTAATFNDFTATGESAYISWDDNGTTKYIGVDAAKYVNVFGGADGRTEAVSVESTSITMTGGTIWRLFGGNYGEEGSTTDYCSVVTGDVNISLSGDAVVKDLLHGAGARNTCVNGTITMEFNGVDLSDLSSQLYVNGGSWGNGNEGTRNIADGTMDTEAVANKVVIKAENSKFYLLGGGGSGSTKVCSSSVTLNNCELSNLYLGGINGEVENSSIVATGCTIEDFSATNRGFVGTANVDLNNCKITEKLNFGAANGCFSTDSGTPDGSGVTGSSVWNIDEATNVTAAQITPLVVRTGSSSNATYATTYENLTIQKAGTPISAAISDFSPVYTSSGTPSVTLNTFSVPEGSALKLSGVTATVAENNTLTNVGTIDMDGTSKLTVDTGATFEQLGTVNGGDVVAEEGGTINDDYVARIGTTGYASLQKAIAEVGDGQTITLLKDIPNAVGISVAEGKNFTVDFAGHTYTLVGPGAGSNGTETNGFQLLEDSTIIFKNGTIRIAENGNGIKRIIQNYANLTLEDMKIYAEHQQPDENYPLSFNNGNIVFKGNTSVYTTKDDTIAFDVCKFSSYPSAIVTFDEDYTGTINGVILYDSADAATHKLIINGNGTFGEIKTASGSAANPSISVSGGTFAQDLSESGYLADTVKYEVGHTGGTFTYAETLADAQSAAKPGDTITDLKATTTYTLTLKYDDSTTADSVYTVAENTEVPLPTPTRDGYLFRGWSDGTNTYDAGAVYRVTDTATLTAQWSVISSGTSYAITVSKADNGTVTASRTRGTKGPTITLTVKADEGYKLDTITVTDKNGNEIKLTDKGDGKYTFTMPASAVTVKASFAKDDTPVETGLPFTDVKADDWFYEAVKYAYDNKLMDGTSSTTFAPLMTTNRAMIVTILWRLEGSPVVNYAMNFSDVESGVWYTEAVRWAAAEGIVKGYSDTVFAPDDTVTREQLATILYRYAEYKEYDVSAKGDLTTFADGSTVSTWAADGMTWAVGAQLITGKDGGKLDPTGTATRAEVATILMRFCENVAK